jgi:hypothetical protein
MESLNTEQLLMKAGSGFYIDILSNYIDNDTKRFKVIAYLGKDTCFDLDTMARELSFKFTLKPSSEHFIEPIKRWGETHTWRNFSAKSDLIIKDATTILYLGGAFALSSESINDGFDVLIAFSPIEEYAFGVLPANDKIIWQQLKEGSFVPRYVLAAIFSFL